VVDLEAQAQSDLLFLKEMKSHYERSLTDITDYQYLGIMINDWISELQNKNKTL